MVYPECSKSQYFCYWTPTIHSNSLHCIFYQLLQEFNLLFIEFFLVYLKSFKDLNFRYWIAIIQVKSNLKSLLIFYLFSFYIFILNLFIFRAIKLAHLKFLLEQTEYNHFLLQSSNQLFILNFPLKFNFSCQYAVSL